MEIKRLLLACAVWLVAGSAVAQIPAPPATASASLTSTTCPGTGCVQLNVSSYASAGIQVTGTWVATLTFEVSIDGATYQAVNATPTNSTSAATTTAANGLWAASVAGQKYLRVRASAYTSGTAVVTLQTALAGGGSGGGGGGGSAPSGTIGAAVPATASPVAVKDNAGNLAYPLVDASGNLLVAVTGAGSGGTSSVDGAGYTAGTTAGTPSMGARDDTGTTACAEDKVCIARLTSSRALMVDGSATTQPVSGTVTTSPPANASTNVAQLAGTATSVNSGTKDAGTLRVVIATDQPALTNKLLVTPDSVALPANQSVNVAQVAGQTTLQGNQNNIASATGAQTVGALGRYDATQPTLTDTRFNLLQLSSRGSLFVTPGVDGFAVTGTVTTTPPANASTNVAQFAGTNVSTGTGNGGAGIPRVTISADSSLAANQSVNVAQINGLSPAADNGASNGATLRVTVANNSTGTVGLNTGANVIGSLSANQTVNLAQVAGTNTVTGGVAGLLAVAGNVANAVAATANPVPVGGIFTTTPTTLSTGQTATLQFTAAQNAKTDLTTIAGTAPTTAGKLDVKGADGDVFVRQATASNLNATVVGTGTFAVQATSNLTQVATQTVLQGDQNNVASATGAQTVGQLGRYNATQPTLTDTRYNLMQLSSRGAQLVATGADVFHITCDTGCTPGGSFADNSAFTFGTTAVNNAGYVVDDNATRYVSENNAGVARMSPLAVAYSDLSQDTSGLAALLKQLTVLVSDLHNDGLHARNDREGYSLRGSFNTFVGSVGDSLKVAQTNQDPCAAPVKNDAAISQTATTKIVPAVPGSRIYICQIRIVVGAAEIVSELEGTGAACATGTIAHSGSTTAANGESFAANGGYQSGTGNATVINLPPGKDFCVGQSTSSRVSGKVTYVYAP